MKPMKIKTSTYTSKIKNKKLIVFLPVIIWMLIIFLFSNQPATKSGEMSQGITEVITNIVGRVVNPSLSIDTLEHFIRKSAHFLEYLMLGLLVCNALGYKRKINWIRIIVCVVICILYAASDEIHQLFVDGRSGRVLDVLIDSAGACCGIGIRMIYRLVLHENNMY